MPTTGATLLPARKEAVVDVIRTFLQNCIYNYKM